MGKMMAMALAHLELELETKLRERVEGRNMAPRQLRLEPIEIEVDSAADKGAN